MQAAKELDERRRPDIARTPNTLSQITTDFAKNELAYLALTSKAELPLRDRVAWRLQVALGESYVVSREWRRADIAVLRGDAPLLQIEAKALYGFDVLRTTTRTKYIQRLASDGLKMAAVAPDSAAYLLALITHVDGTIQPHLRKHVVKYSSGIRAATARLGNAAAVTTAARGLWQEALTQFACPSRRFLIEAGVMWGMHVEVDAYLIGPLPREAAIHPLDDGDVVPHILEKTPYDEQMPTHLVRR
jgi:hypothetical protein